VDYFKIEVFFTPCRDQRFTLMTVTSHAIKFLMYSVFGSNWLENPFIDAVFAELK
jgi:hypothetical protein